VAKKPVKKVAKKKKKPEIAFTMELDDTPVPSAFDAALQSLQGVVTDLQLRPADKVRGEEAIEAVRAAST